mgnify:CR=1 FL=1
MVKRAQGTNGRDTPKPLDTDSSVANGIPYSIFKSQEECINDI